MIGFKIQHNSKKAIKKRGYEQVKCLLINKLSIMNIKIKLKLIIRIQIKINQRDFLTSELNE